VAVHSLFLPTAAERNSPLGIAPSFFEKVPFAPLFNMFRYLLSMLFPHGLYIPGHGIVGDTGGSDAAVAGGVVSPGSPVAPLPAVAGDVSPLSASRVRFNAGMSTNGTSGSFDIFAHNSVAIMKAGRMSAKLVSSLTIQVTIAPADAAAPSTLLSGWVAIMPEAGHGQTYPNTVATVSCLPGAIAITVSPLVSGTGVLPIPPGIRDDAIIQTVIGRDPALVFAFAKVNVSSAQIVVSGELQLSGIGYWGGFF